MCIETWRGYDFSYKCTKFPNKFINYFPYPKESGNKGNSKYTEKLNENDLINKINSNKEEVCLNLLDTCFKNVKDIILENKRKNNKDLNDVKINGIENNIKNATYFMNNYFDRVKKID